MNTGLLAILILTSWAQERRGERLLPEQPRERRAGTVRVMVPGEPRGRELTLAMPAPSAPDDENVEEQPVPVVRHNIRTMVVEQENFDRWLFGEEESEAAWQRHLDQVLQTKIKAVDREHKLTDQQRAKLKLAGRGDIKRFFDEVQKKRNAFEEDRKNINTGLAALQRLKPLTKLYQEGPFGDGSLFAKTLRRIDDDQKAGH